jgi:selenocysteine lyase/cysteine desulfurase
MTFRTGAQRYEAGTHNLLGIVGMNAALEMLLEVGVESIGQDLLRKRAFLVARLRERGWDVLHGEAEESMASGIVSFWKQNEDMPALHARLAENQVLTSLRVDRAGTRFIRLSPHFYNTEQELKQLLHLL